VSLLELGGGTINLLTADASPDSSTDYVMTYDASAAELKKVLIDNLPSSGGDMFLAGVQTITGSKTFNSGTLLLNNPLNTFSYGIIGSAITNNILLQLPLITATDTLVSLGVDQTFSGTNTFDSEVTINGSPFTVNGAITTLSSTTSTSITSPLIVLGDEVTDSISIGGTVDMNSNDILVLELGGGTINLLTADASPDSSTDYVMTYDASAAELKKVLIDNLPSSGGVSLPIITDVSVLGTVTTAQDIDLSLDTAHSTSLTLGADIDVTFSSYPTTGTQIEWEVEITQGDTTAFEITWPSELVNPPNASAYSTLDSVTVIVFRTNDGGITVRVGNTVTTSTTGASALSDVTIDVSKDWGSFGITNLGGITMTDDINFSSVDATNIDRLRFVSDSGAPSSTSDPSIFLDSSSNMVFNVNTLLDISFKALNVEIAKFTEAVTGVYLLDMSDHYIDNIKSTRYSEDQGAVTFASNQPAIGYDSVDSQFKFNTPTLTEFQFTVDSVDIMQITNAAMTFQTNFQIICQPSLTGVAGINVGGMAGDVASPANGDIHYNSSTGTFRFYQNGSYTELGGSGSQTPWTSDINADTFDLTELDRLLFSQTAGESLVSTTTGITSDAIGSMNFNIPSGTQYEFFVAGAVTSALTIGSTSITSQSLFPKESTIDTLGSSAIPWLSADIGSITMGGSETSIDNVGEISFLATTQSISSTSTDMFFDLPSGDGFTFRINSVETFQILATGNLQLNNKTIFGIEHLSFDITDQDIESGTGGLTYGVPTSDTHDFQVNSTSVMEITGLDIDVNQDLDFISTATIDFGTSQSSASAGSAGSLPASVEGYITIRVVGVDRKIPIYNT